MGGTIKHDKLMLLTIIITFWKLKLFFLVLDDCLWEQFNEWTLCASNCSGISYFLLLFKLVLKTEFSLRCKSHLSTSEIHLSCSGYHGDTHKHATTIGESFRSWLKRMQNNTLECNGFMKIHKVKTECFSWLFRAVLIRVSK